MSNALLTWNELEALTNEKRAIRARLHALGVCSKCGGAGRMLAYGHVQQGVCFRCDGTGRRAPTRGRAAAELCALHTRLGEIEIVLAAHNEEASKHELPDLESLDLDALVGAA